MNLTIAELLQDCLATPVFLLLFIPAGFLLGWCLNVLDFRSRSRTEQSLWSTSLSVPLALVIANVLGRYLPPLLILSTFLLLDLACLRLVLKQRGSGPWQLPLDKPARVVLFALLGAVVYLWLASLPICFHRHIYEPVFSSDWEIRLPLVHAAIRDGIPPHNPFFTFRGQSPPMRYYFYWYGLCAQLGRLVHTDARSILVASSVYAMLGIVATLFLYLKYMVTSTAPLRRRCALLLGLCCVLGLDVLPSLLGLFLWHARLQPEIEWWLQDRSPGLPGAILFGPHHVAGIACGLLGFLALATLAAKEQPASSRRSVAHGVLAAICFAALVGTSSFVMLFFAAACAILFIDQLRRGDRAVPAALALAAVLALAASVPYLRELTAKTVVAHGNSQGKHALKLQLRGDVQGQRHLFVLARRLHLPYPNGPVRFVPRLIVVVLHIACELGFYLFILVLQFRRDFRSGQPMHATTRALWILALSTAAFFLFVNSSPIQEVNDLGVHAGLLLRVLFTLWGAQIVAEYVATPKALAATPRQQWVVRGATLCLALGVAMTLWQVIIERTYLVLLDRHIVPHTRPFPADAHLSAFYNDVYEAQTAAAHLLPSNAVVQSNPVSRYGLIFHLYQQRRQAAGDASCEGSFGGDPALCQSFLPGILGLFGVHERVSGGLPPTPIDPVGRTLEAFSNVCSQDGLTALLASHTDPVWFDPQSWVWTGHVLFANETVRLIACPTT